MCGSNFYESDVTTNKIIKPIIDHDLKNFANSRPSASNLNIFSRSLEQFFITVGQNNFGNKIVPCFDEKTPAFVKMFT